MQKSYYVVDHNTIIKLIFSVRGRHKLSFAVLALSGADLQGHKKAWTLSSTPQGPRKPATMDKSSPRLSAGIHDLSGLLLEIS